MVSAWDAEGTVVPVVVLDDVPAVPKAKRTPKAKAPHVAPADMVFGAVAVSPADYLGIENLAGRHVSMRTDSIESPGDFAASSKDPRASNWYALVRRLNADGFKALAMAQHDGRQAALGGF